MKRSEYFSACATHDWYYAFSEDMRVYRAGSSAESNLKGEAKSDKVKQAIYDAWHDYYFSGQAFGTEKAPKPEIQDFDIES